MVYFGMDVVLRLFRICQFFDRVSETTCGGFKFFETLLCIITCSVVDSLFLWKSVMQFSLVLNLNTGLSYAVLESLVFASFC